MKLPLVYVVVLNWNLSKDTSECVASVLDSDFPNYQVLVVDNGSTDGSPDILRARFPGIEVLVNKTNLGFAAGNNVGIRYALQREADYVCLLNSDTVVDPCMLTKMVDVAESESSVGIVAPKILYYDDRKRIWWLGSRRHKWLPTPLSIGRGTIDKGQWTEPQELDYVSGCGMLIRRSVLKEIGLFDTRYFMYYEDADFCRRAREAGFRVLCVPEAKMWHKVSLSAMKDQSRTRYLKTRNRILFYRRYAHGPHPWLTAFWLGLSALKTTVIDAWRGDRALIACQWRGFLDGYREALTED